MWPFSVLKRRRRERILLSSPIPEPLWAWAMESHGIFARLPPEDRAILRDLATVFLAEKTIAYAEGEERGTDGEAFERLRVSIAAQACLPILRLGMDWYDGWSTIVLASDAFAFRRKETDAAGVVTEYDDEISGQVTEFGPVVLSVADIDESGWGDGYNVVIHEMAHKLDERDGVPDGCPPLPRSIPAGEWTLAFSAAFADFSRRVAAPRRRGRKGASGRSRIDEYAAYSPDEFFAVVSEHFFETPGALKREYPEVYSLLSRFYAQDPEAGRARGPGASLISPPRPATPGAWTGS